MVATVSIRLSEVIVSDARRVAEMFDCTIGEQVEYWVRLGQAVESIPGFDTQRLRAVLDGQFEAEMLSPDEKRVFVNHLRGAFVARSAKSVTPGGSHG